MLRSVPRLLRAHRMPRELSQNSRIQTGLTNVGGNSHGGPRHPWPHTCPKSCRSSRIYFDSTPVLPGQHVQNQLSGAYCAQIRRCCLRLGRADLVWEPSSEGGPVTTQRARYHCDFRSLPEFHCGAVRVGQRTVLDATCCILQIPKPCRGHSVVPLDLLKQS